MVKIKVVCNNCNNDMSYISSSGNSDLVFKEIWECPVCNFEVMVIYQDGKKNV